MAAEDHGKYNTYDAHGCRCDDCSAAHAARVADQRMRRRLRGQEPPEHGTVSAYTNYGCRCLDCSAAMHAYHVAHSGAVMTNA